MTCVISHDISTYLHDVRRCSANVRVERQGSRSDLYLFSVWPVWLSLPPANSVNLQQDKASELCRLAADWSVLQVTLLYLLGSYHTSLLFFWCRIDWSVPGQSEFHLAMVAYVLCVHSCRVHSDLAVCLLNIIIPVPGSRVPSLQNYRILTA